MENYEKELGKFWPPNVVNATWGTVDARGSPSGHSEEARPTVRRIGVETRLPPCRRRAALREGLPGAKIVDALFPLERLRARKT